MQTDAQDEITAFKEGTENEMTAALENQANADELDTKVDERVTDAEDTANELMTDNERRQQIIQTRIDTALEGIDQMPAKISAEVDRINSE